MPARPTEEFPFFREFWIETPEPGIDQVTIYALLDSASTTGAYRFDLYPGVDSALDVAENCFPAQARCQNLGLAA